MFSSSGTIPLTTSFFSRGKAPVLVLHLDCSEDAVTLHDCNVQAFSISTSHYRYLNYIIFPAYNSDVHGLICQGNVTSEPECVPGDARLAGGLKSNEGRVEVCIDGFWGTVCEEGWDDEDAIVICKQLGLLSTGNSTYTRTPVSV